jgi:predicted PurR-regulated permease PerM
MPPRARPVLRNDLIHLAIRIGLLAFLVYWSFVLVEPFISIIAWSMILTAGLYPAYHWLAGKLGGQQAVAAILVTLASMAIIIGPLTWFALSLMDGLRIISESLDAADLTLPRPPPAIRDWPLVGETIYQFWDLASTNIAAALTELAPHLKPLAKPVLGMAASVGEGMLKFLLALVLMGFLFAPGPRMIRGLKALLTHVIPERGDEFVALAGATIRSISLGILGVSVLQALLAGIGFKMAGIPAASVLTCLALFLAIVQIGAGIVVFGVLVWIWATTDTTTALLLTAYLVPVALLDNILKPIVMGHGLKTPMPVILIGVLGGTLAHGVVGLFVGPIVLAIGWQLAAVWMRDNAPAVATSSPAQVDSG